MTTFTRCERRVYAETNSRFVVAARTEVPFSISLYPIHYTIIYNFTILLYYSSRKKKKSLTQSLASARSAWRRVRKKYTRTRVVSNAFKKKKRVIAKLGIWI
jgi:hypothetical protein